MSCYKKIDEDKLEAAKRKALGISCILESMLSCPYNTEPYIITQTNNELDGVYDILRRTLDDISKLLSSAKDSEE